MAPFAPLVLARLYDIPQEEVACTLGVSTRRLRTLAQDPKHAQRILVAELETILAKERHAGMEGQCGATARAR
jgi:hypothetical protein